MILNSEWASKHHWDILKKLIYAYMYDYFMCKSAQESYEGHILGGEAPIAFPSSLILSAFWRRLDSSLGAIRANGNAPVSVCPSSTFLRP